MTNIFEGLPFVQRTIFAGELVAAALVIFWGVKKFFGNKNVSVDLSKGQVNYSQESGAEATANMTNGIFFLTLETVTMMTQIKTKLILHDQMTYLEERLVFIKNAVLDSYRGKMREKGNSDMATTKEYLFYKSLVELMKEDLKSNIRTLFLRNHFASYDEKEMSAYMAEKGPWLNTEMLDFIRDLYPSEKMAVSFEEVEETFLESRKQVDEYLAAIFKKAAQIYNERHQQITDLESGLRVKIKNTYGVDLGDGGVHAFSSILKGGVPTR